MEDKLVFDYFYGAESEQFTFYRIPKLLISDKRFSSLSSDAKLLYGLMLERMSLSRRNNWFDEENRAFINYTVENVMDDLGCANGKACKLISQLEDIGLIERIKPGLGKPAQIYVKNFMSIFDRGNPDETQMDGNVEEDQWEDAKTLPIQEDLDEKKPANAHEFTDVRKSHVKECENRTSGDAEIARQEMRKPHVKRCENRTSGDAEIARQEMRKSHGNDTEYSDTDMSDTEYSDTDVSDTKIPSFLPSSSSPSGGSLAGEKEWNRRKERKDDSQTSEEEDLAYGSLIRKNIWYDYYMQHPSFPNESKSLYDMLYHRILRVVTKKPDLCVKGCRIPGEVAKSAFLKLRGEHVLSCIDKLGKVEAEVKNPGAYMDSMLYCSLTECMEHDAVDAVQASGAFERDAKQGMEFTGLA